MRAYPTGGNGSWQPSDFSFSQNTGSIKAITDGLSRKERSDFSLRKCILHLAGENGIDATLEREVSDTIAQKLGRVTRGMYIPTQLKPQATALSTLTDGAGKYTVMTEVRDLIELLRARTRVIQMGATLLTGLQGNQQFPRHLTGTTGTWMGENSGSDVQQVDATFGTLNLVPHTYQSTTAFSRQLLAQSSIDIENFVRTDIADYHSQAIDAAAINGSGNSNEPLGILKTPSIGDVAMGANGAVPTYAKIVDLEAKVATANADEAGMKFLTTPGVRGVLRKTALLDATTSPLAVWQGGTAPGVGNLIGFDAYVSTQVPSTLDKGALRAEFATPSFLAIGQRC